MWEVTPVNRLSLGNPLSFIFFLTVSRLSFQFIPMKLKSSARRDEKDRPADIIQVTTIKPTCILFIFYSFLPPLQSRVIQKPNNSSSFYPFPKNMGITRNTIINPAKTKRVRMILNLGSICIVPTSTLLSLFNPVCASTTRESSLTLQTLFMERLGVAQLFLPALLPWHQVEKSFHRSPFYNSPSPSL
jgi:hypothetical protein